MRLRCAYITSGGVLASRTDAFCNFNLLAYLNFIVFILLFVYKTFLRPNFFPVLFMFILVLMFLIGRCTNLANKLYLIVFKTVGYLVSVEPSSANPHDWLTMHGRRSRDTGNPSQKKKNPITASHRFLLFCFVLILTQMILPSPT